MDKAERKSMIKVRGGFSEDMGFNPCNTQPQTSEFDNRTRTFISNRLYDFLQIAFEHETEMRNLRYGSSDQNLSTVFCKDLIQNVFTDNNHLPVGHQYNWGNLYSRIEKVIMEAPYNEVLDLLWYICYWLSIATHKCFNIFQKLVVDLMKAMDYGDGFVTKYSGDGGVDGIIHEDKLGFNLIYIQAKRWDPSTTIGKPELQKFAGAMMGPPKIEKGLFITTAKFSQGAKDFANAQHIILVDGQKLTTLMIEYSIGVSVEKTYYIKRIDSDYFPD